MENNTEKKVYDTRVIPFVRYEKRERKGKKYEEPVDNLTVPERMNMSCTPKMLRKGKDDVYYIDDMPLTFNGGTGIKGFLCYVFDELTEEEQKIFFDRSIVIPTTIESSIGKKVDSSKKVFRRSKNRERR